MKKTNHVILTAREDDEFGGIGLCIEGMSRDGINPATSGLLVAHDLLEHQNGPYAIGTIDDELEALGGVWFVRGRFGVLSKDGAGSNYTIHENIASDVVRMFRDFFYGQHVDTAPRTMPCDADVHFMEIIQCAAKTWKPEIDSDDLEAAEKKFKEYVRVCLPRMRIGYRKAAKRFKGITRPDGLFWAIERAMKSPLLETEYEGQRFELIYGFNDNGQPFARCYEHYEEDDSND